MRARSLLFIPGDSEKKLAKGDECGADAIIVDLEDSVAAGAKPAARSLVRDYLLARSGGRQPAIWVRINDLDSDHCDADLLAVVPAGPDGIILPKARSAGDVDTLAEKLDTLEQQHQLEQGAIGIIPVATEVPEAIFAMGSYMSCSSRLRGITWGAEDLSAAIGASANKEADGQWTNPYQLARALCLFAANASDVAPIDTIYDNFRDPGGLRAACNLSRRDGFMGKLAIHPAQVAVINEAFTPSTQELAFARQVVELFEANPESGALSLGGKMLDMPHLKQAMRILSQAPGS